MLKDELMTAQCICLLVSKFPVATNITLKEDTTKWTATYTFYYDRFKKKTKLQFTNKRIYTVL
jgi:hypothetical protein